MSDFGINCLRSIVGENILIQNSVLENKTFSTFVYNSYPALLYTNEELRGYFVLHGLLQICIDDFSV